MGEAGESDLIYDQRKTNQGRPEGNFEEFYKELDNLMEEYGKAAEERRHSLVAHMPLAVSIPQLLRKVWLLFVCLASFFLMKEFKNFVD